MYVNDSSLPFEEGCRYEIVFTHRDLVAAKEQVAALRPSHAALPSEWLRWFLDIAEARGQ